MRQVDCGTIGLTGYKLPPDAHKQAKASGERKVQRGVVGLGVVGRVVGVAEAWSWIVAVGVYCDVRVQVVCAVVSLSLGLRTIGESTRNLWVESGVAKLSKS